MDVLPDELRNITAFVLYNMSCTLNATACQVFIIYLIFIKLLFNSIIINIILYILMICVYL